MPFPPARSVAGTVARVVAFVLVFFVCAILTGLLLGPVLTWVVSLTGQRVRIDYYLELVAALAATAVMLRAVDERDWSAVDLARDAARPRTLAAGWLLGSAAIVLTAGILLGAGWLRFVPADALSSWAGAATRVTIVLLPAALAEEVLCRGYLLSVLRDRAGTTAAVLITSSAFAILHVWNPGATVESVLVVLLAGIFLAAVRLAFASLYAAWMAHLAWNWVMAVPLHAVVSGTRFEAPGYRAVTAGPSWLSGGAWGPEGGVVAAVGFTAALGFLYTRQRREES